MDRRITAVHLVATLRDGGAEALVRALVPQLAREPDLDIHVVSVYPSRLTPNEVRRLGAPLHEIGRRGRQDIAFAPRLVRTLAAIRPQIVHGHIHTGKYAGRAASIVAGVPHLVFTEHGDEAGGPLRTIVKAFLNARTSRFIVFTDEERQRYARLEHIALEKIAVIPNGIPLPLLVDRAALRASLAVRDDETMIVSAARLVPQKNQQLAIRALDVLHTRGRRKTALYLIGEGPDRAQLEALADHLGLAHAVRFLGFRNDAADILAAADVFALPSIWEKMPLVLGEAMLRSTAVVSTRWKGVEPFIEHGITGWLSAGDEPVAFADALELAIADVGRRAAVTTRAAAFAREQFDLGRASTAHADLYRRLVNDRARV